MATATLLVTCPADAGQRRSIQAELPEDVACRFVEDLAADRRGDAVEGADALPSMVPTAEIEDEEIDRLHGGRIL